MTPPPVTDGIPKERRKLLLSRPMKAKTFDFHTEH